MRNSSFIQFKKLRGEYMAHVLVREALNPIHINMMYNEFLKNMHEIKMSVSQLIIVGFEKLKRQNVHQHLLYTLRGGEGVTKKCAFCTLSINVDIFGWPLNIWWPAR